MRDKVSKAEYQQMSNRLIDLARNDLGLSLGGLANRLGYKNQSPLTKVRQGKGFIGPDKLKLFALLENDNGDTPNLNWIITGLGEPMLSPVNTSSKLLSELVKKAGLEKTENLLSLFVGCNSLSKNKHT